MANAQVFDFVIILKPEMVSFGDDSRVDSFVKIEGGLGVRIGRHVHICSFSHINLGGGEVEIGDYVGITSGVRVLGGSNCPEGLSMSAVAPREMQVVRRLRTVIETYAFLGANSVVMPGVTIGEGAVIGAGAVVTRDVPAWEVWAGVPAKRIGIRAIGLERQK